MRSDVRWAECAVEVPALDLGVLRAAFADPAVRRVHAPHRAGLLEHPRAGAVRALDPAFRYVHAGPVETIAPTLARALRRAGLSSNKAREALVAEAAHLVRVFAGLTGALELDARLAVADPAAPEPPPVPLPESTRSALVFALDLSGGDLASGGAVLLRLDSPGEELGDPTRMDAMGGGRRLLLWLGSGSAPLPLKPRREPAGEPAEVVLASMPFGILDQPSLALGLLQASLPPGAARSLYLTLPFARRIGVPLYQWIAQFQPFFTALAGEWLFGGGLFPTAGGQAYLEEVLLRPTAAWRADSGDDPSFFTLMPEGLVADILRAREAVDGFLDECVEEVLAHRPKVVGLTSIFQQQTASLALARRLKERAPEVFVVLGGSNCEGPMGAALVRNLPFLDAVVSGEGDVVFPRLVERVLAGQPLADLPGVHTRDSPAVLERGARPPNAPSPRHMDDLPYPDFGDYFAQLRASGLEPATRPKLVLETARGCWWGAKQHCTFCGLNGGTMAFRAKSPERALAELRTLAARHPGLPIDMADNILDMKYFRTFLPRLAEAGLDLQLFYEVKANLKKEELRLLRAAGVRALQPGIESLSDEVLKLMRKGVTALQNIQLLKWCRELGLWPFWNLLSGFPGEPPEEYERMMELLPLLHHLPPPAGWFPIVLERFSPNFDRGDELGFAEVRPVPVYSHIYPFPAEDLMELAYFFQFRNRDGRDVAGYTRGLATCAQEWRESHEQSRLAALDLGERLVVYDSRPMAAQPLHFLEGLARTLYRACDQIQSVESLRRTAAAETGRDPSREEIEEILGPLSASGLVVRQGESVLALAVSAQSNGR